MDKEIGQKEIRGINGKVLFGVFSTLVIILFSVIMSYANIMYELKDNRKTSGALQLQIDVLRADLKQVQQNQAQYDIRLTRIEVEIKDKIFIKDAP